MWGTTKLRMYSGRFTTFRYTPQTRYPHPQQPPPTQHSPLHIRDNRIQENGPLGCPSPARKKSTPASNTRQGEFSPSFRHLHHMKWYRERGRGGSGLGLGPRRARFVSFARTKHSRTQRVNTWQPSRRRPVAHSRVFKKNGKRGDKKKENKSNQIRSTQIKPKQKSKSKSKTKTKTQATNS